MFQKTICKTHINFSQFRFVSQTGPQHPSRSDTEFWGRRVGPCPEAGTDSGDSKGWEWKVSTLCEKGFSRTQVTYSHHINFPAPDSVPWLFICDEKKKKESGTTLTPKST